MKLYKIMALALGSILFTACSDDDFNTASDVTVQMGVSELTVSESAGSFKVPVVVTGEANGPIKVSVSVESTGTNPALPFEERNGEWSGNFMVTSQNLNIPEGVKTVNIDIKAIDDRDENENRTFIITIASVEGAAVGTVNQTLVTLKDNDNVPYGKIQGDWNFNFKDYDGAAANWPVAISGYEEGTAEYDTFLDLYGLLGDSSSNLGLDFSYDEATGECYVEMLLPEAISWYNASNVFWVLNWPGGPASGVGPSLRETVIRGEVSADFKTITFDQDITLCFYVAAPDFSAQLGVYEAASEISMTR